MDSTTSPATRADMLIAHMSLAEKIGQMTQVEQRAITPDEATRYRIGSILSGGGGNPSPNTPQTWAEMVHGFQAAALRTPLAIPLIYGADAVHGHSNVVGATIFPHNIGLGATRDAGLMERIGRATAVETSATGVLWNFAPCVAVPQDLRWGRTYEGFSQQTELVAELGAAYVRGLQGKLGAPGSVLACPKHFVADGGTTWGTSQQYAWLAGESQAADPHYQIDQGDARMDEATLRQIHLSPYTAAIQAGARSIMVSFSSWNGVKLHAHHYLLTQVLKGEFGFSGFLVSDWHAIDQLSADPYQCVVRSINAGLDMIMVPFEYRRFITLLTQAVEAGDVPPTRIDDAVRRILTVKFELGLFERRIELEPGPEMLGHAEHRRLAREAVRKSLVLLKNDGNTLPFSKHVAHVVLAGQAADDIGLQCGGWTIEWQGSAGDITPGASLLQAVRQAVSTGTRLHFSASGEFPAELHAEIGIVCLHERPYAEGVGDQADLSLAEVDRQLIQRVRAHCDRLTVILFSGRPLIITSHLPLADAWVAAWLPGTEGQGMADVLFGDYPFAGTLPYTWPRDAGQLSSHLDQRSNVDGSPLFPFGFGSGV